MAYISKISFLTFIPTLQIVFKVKMDLEKEALLLLLLRRRMKRRRKRIFWVHPIIKNKMKTSLIGFI